MKALKTENKIIVGIPKSFVRPNAVDNAETDGYDTATAYHDIDGWGDILPKEPIDDMTQGYGNIEWIEADNTFFYPIVELTPEEKEIKIEQLKDSIVIQDEQSKETMIENEIRSTAKTKLINEVENIEVDNTEKMEWSTPFQQWWSGDSEVIELGDIRKAFDNNNELRLYEAITAHTTQEDWKPKDEGALWKLIPFPGEYEVWSERDGSNGYSKDTIVWFPTKDSQLYKSKVDKNVYSPTEYPDNWEIYNE